MEGKHPISEILESSMQKLRELVDVNTIIGDPIVSGGVTIIPISKVSFGFASGGADVPTQKPESTFGCGSGGGVTIQPLAFLVINNDGKVDILGVPTADNTADRLVNLVPSVVDKLSALLSKKQEEKTLQDS